MPVLARAARYVLALVDMTEADAVRKFELHVAQCRKGCAPARGLACKEGLRLHDQWKAQEARQSAPSGRR